MSEATATAAAAFGVIAHLTATLLVGRARLVH